MYSCSADRGVIPRSSRRLLQLAEVGKVAADHQLGLALLAGALAHLLQAVVNQVQFEIVLVDAGRVEPEDAHPAEHEADAAGGGEIAAVLVEDVAHVADGPRRIVGGGLDEHGDPVGRVPLVDHFLVVRHVLARGPLDGGVHLVLGHVDGAGVGDDPAQGRVVVRVGPGGLHGDGDVLADPRELLGHAVPAGKHHVFSGFEYASHGLIVSDVELSARLPRR